MKFLRSHSVVFLLMAVFFNHDCTSGSQRSGRAGGQNSVRLPPIPTDGRARPPLKELAKLQRLTQRGYYLLNRKNPRYKVYSERFRKLARKLFKRGQYIIFTRECPLYINLSAMQEDQGWMAGAYSDAICWGKNLYPPVTMEIRFRKAKYAWGRPDVNGQEFDSNALVPNKPGIVSMVKKNLIYRGSYGHHGYFTGVVLVHRATWSDPHIVKLFVQIVKLKSYPLSQKLERKLRKRRRAR